MGLTGRERTLGRKAGLPARRGEEKGGTRWKRGSVMWQNVD